MEKPLFTVFSILLVLWRTVRGFPIEFSSVNAGEPNSLWSTSYFITVFGCFLTTVAVVLGCVCCRNSKGFKEFSNSNSSLSNTRSEGFVNPTSNAELTIFPPAEANANQLCRFEPLPDIKPFVPNLRPAAFSSSERDISSQDWFAEPCPNFPRNQLKYVEEYGRGWFGRVVKGEAQNITVKEKLTKVMVKILHEDATPTDQMYFLHEVKFYKDLNHPNILRLLGRCLETEPFLVILECYPNGDLKTFLSQNLVSAEALSEQGVILQMCSNITSGLQYMHKHKFIHTDLAARNCLVGPDLTVKIGDYGNSIENFKSDYYCAGSVALPIRWCAPETLKCTDVTIETREVTPSANIWSLGVVFWEISEFCKLPYGELNDDQVIIRVLGEKNYFLEKPSLGSLYKDELYHLMKLCWNSPLQRPTAAQLSLILENLISSKKVDAKENQINSKRLSQDFEQRWQNFLPNYIPKKDDAVQNDHTAGCNVIPSKLKTSKIIDSSLVDSPLGYFMAGKISGHDSPRFCLKSVKPDVNIESEKQNNLYKLEEINHGKDGKNYDGKTSEANFQLNTESRPTELLNPNHRFKDSESEVDSWLKGVEINSEEDESFLQKISEAIRDLDAALAMEKTSSSEEGSGKSTHQSSPEKDIKENNEAVVDFKLGSDISSFKNFTQKSFELSSLQNSEQPQSLSFADSFINNNKNEINKSSENDNMILSIATNLEKDLKFKNYSAAENFKEHDSLTGTQSRNSSDTDDEVWRKRIERGEISEKVKEKSKSIANLMILTHIDVSDDSDNDMDRTINRHSLFRKSGLCARSSASSNIFGSENDITNAVLEDEFQESLKKLSNDHKEFGHFDSLGMIMPTFAGRENAWESLIKNNDCVENLNQRTLTQTEAHEQKEETNFNNNLKEKNSSFQNQSEQITNSMSNNSSDHATPEELRSSKLKLDNSVRNDFNMPPGKENFHSDQEKEQINSIFNITGSPSVNSSHLIDEAFYKSSENKEDQLKSLKFDNNSEQNIDADEHHENLESFTYKSNTGNYFLAEGRHSLSINVEFEDNLNSLSKSLENKVIVNNEFLTLDEKLPIPHIVVSGDSKEKYQVEEVLTVPEAQTKSFRFLCENKDLSDRNSSEEKCISKLKENIVQDEIVSGSPNIFNPDGCKINNGDNESKSKILEESKISSNSYSSFINEKEDDLNKNKKFRLNIDSLRKECNEQNAVIVGACEDYTLEFFKGLTTTSEDLNFDEKADTERDKSLQNIDSSELNKDSLKFLNKESDNQNFSNNNNNNCKRIFSELESQNFELKNLKKKESTSPKNSNLNVFCSLEVIDGFIKMEKLHTDKLAESYDTNKISNLARISSEEEYDNYKLRTPDDERSSDSGFRDKGSLSESVEDACEGKYNLEDIEAELEDAYVKEAFENCETEKQKNAEKNFKNDNIFEHEESKFYEDESKNDNDLSDIDGEIEFWQNKDGSDYYPEISEFNPICSQGWYLHPPEENSLTYNRSMNEDIANAIRNELRENLPVQTRSFQEFNDNYCTLSSENVKRDLSTFANDLSGPLSPIVEENDSFLIDPIKNDDKNIFLESNASSRIRKNVVNLMETVKSIDTNTFMQYLDYMVENEGKGLDELEEITKGNADVTEYFNKTCHSNIAPEEKQNLKSVDLVACKASECKKSPFIEEENIIGFSSVENDESGFESNTDQNTKSNDDFVVFDEIIKEVVKTNDLNEITSKITLSEDDIKSNVLDENSKDDGLMFSSGISTPDRERSLSEVSRSSNETRTGDALSEITLSSPDLVPDCFSSTQNIDSNEMSNELKDHNEETLSKTIEIEKQDYISQPQPFLSKETRNFLEVRSAITTTENIIELKPNSSSQFNAPKESSPYEMSTSFMGDDYDCNIEDGRRENITTMNKLVHKNDLSKTIKEYDAELDSDNSLAEEETSSSSGEFIWKDGDRVSKLKALQVDDCDTGDSLFNHSKVDSFAQKQFKIHVEETGFKGEQFREKNDKEDDAEDEDEEVNEDDNESSTGSSTSVTDFIPSAWNCQATPGRSVLKNIAENTADSKQKKNVWFKKQKYHCVYEYPREPSDNEELEPFNQFAYDQSLGNSNQKFTCGVDSADCTNKQYPYTLSNFNMANYSEWDLLDGDDGDLSLTDTDSDNGCGKGNGNENILQDSDFKFFSANSFDYDFNSAGILNNQSEFSVSSSSRPFQGSLINQYYSEKDKIIAFDEINDNLNSKSMENNDYIEDLRDFTTPDSGLEDSESVSPVEKKTVVGSQRILLEVNDLIGSKDEMINILGNLKFNFAPETVETNNINSRAEIFDKEQNTSTVDLFPTSCKEEKVSLSNQLSPNSLGELRHVRGRLKLDLPFNHNADLGGMIGKKINRIH